MIPGNDDALRAIRLFASRIADAIIEGRQVGTEGASAEVEADETVDTVDEAPVIESRISIPKEFLTPDEVADRIAHEQRQHDIGHLQLEAQESRMDHETTMRSIELMVAKVIPAMAGV